MHYDVAAARVRGLAPGQVTVIIHHGSRGFGYQICSDYLDVMHRAVRRYAIPLLNRRLTRAPTNSRRFNIGGRNGNASLVEAKNVSTRGFDVDIRTWLETQVWSCGGFRIAYTA